MSQNVPMSFLIPALEELFSLAERAGRAFGQRRGLCIAQSSFWPSEAGEGIRRGRNYRVVVWTRGPLVLLLGSIFLPAGFPAGFEKSRAVRDSDFELIRGIRNKEEIASSDQQRQRSDLVS